MDQEVLNSLKKTCAQRDHTFKLDKTETNRVKFTCNRHGFSATKKAAEYLQAKWGIHCCDGHDNAFAKIDAKAKERNHEITNFKFIQTRGCTFDVYCPIHGQLTKDVSYDSYTDKRVKWGVQCCSSGFKSSKTDPASQVLTLARSKQATWRRGILKKCQNCAVTGCTGDQHQLEIHHLYSSADYPQLKYVPMNGLVLLKSVHKLFHSELKDKNQKATPAIFLCFLRSFDQAKFLDLQQFFLASNSPLPPVLADFSHFKESLIPLEKQLEQIDSDLQDYLKDTQNIPPNEQNPFLKTDVKTLQEIKAQLKKISGLVSALDNLIVSPEYQNKFSALKAELYDLCQKGRLLN